ncbi:MAG: glycosyltransferase family 4 protein [Nanoarchaeota archaeon]
MKVLMFGWEFPPVISGGLGTACYGLTKGLSNNNVEVTFVMPTGPSDTHHDHLNVIVADKILFDHVKLKRIPSLLVPYLTSGGYDQNYRKLLMKYQSAGHSPLYGQNIFEEAYRFSEIAKLIAQVEDFDVIHCHDWMTYQAGIKAKEVSKKPLVVHVHATEFDRTGFNSVNQYVYDLEREGMHKADRIIAVSNYTKEVITKHYGISPEKVEVVHNAVEFTNYPDLNPIKKHDKVVLFLGRITLQKGPDYFIEAAKKVLERDQNVKFIMAGSGDMENRMIERAAELGIANKVLFAGFLKGEAIDKMYKMADLFVMPSVSEPFGITPLEALRNGTPVLISKTSGVSEVLSHCLKADFWDVNELSNKILSVLHYNSLKSELRDNGNLEIRKFNWDIPAKKCLAVYQSVLKEQG